MQVLGRARDLVTARNGSVAVVGAACFEACFGADWKLQAIASSPPRAGLEKLVGLRGGGGFRKALREVMPVEADGSDPLWLILDDIVGAVLVSSVAWAEWDSDWEKKAFGGVPIEQLLKARENVCIGHAAGSSAQTREIHEKMPRKPDAASLLRADDPVGWHAMETQDGVGFRRMRRMDIVRTEEISIDAEFQDSATKPDGGRIAVHEYSIRATADQVSSKLLSLEAEPRVLPYGECPGVMSNLPRLLGEPLGAMRRAVPAALPGAAGCTHLNDALRALADVPALLRCLDGVK